jgi:MATE family multidrug resistance protein
MTTADATLGDLPAALPEPTTSWGGELRALFRLSWPLVLAQLAQNALFTTDVVFMGQLGPKYLAAGFLAASFFVSFQLFGIGLVGAVAPMVAQALGARDIKSVRRIVRAGFWTAIITGALILPFAWNVRPIFLLLGQLDEASLLAEQFLHYAMWLIFPALMIIVLRSFLAAHGSTKVILLITLVGVAINALGNYVLVLGNWGFPRLGLRGSGITTTTVNVIMLALMVLHVATHRRFRRYHLFARLFEADWDRLRAIIRVGLPMGLMVLAEVGLFVCAAFLMGWLGTDEVAAHGVAIQWASLAFMVPLGLGQAATVRVGLAYGRGSAQGIRKAGWMSLCLTVAFMSLTCVLFLALPQVLVGLFLNPALPENRNALLLATTYLGIAGIFQLADGAQVTAAAALRGLSDTKWPLLIALFGYWVIGLPVAYIGGFVLGGRGIGVWIGLAVGLAVVAVILVARFAMREPLGLLRKRPAMS